MAQTEAMSEESTIGRPEEPARPLDAGEVDARFAQIVAGWGLTAPGSAPADDPPAMPPAMLPAPGDGSAGLPPGATGSTRPADPGRRPEPLGRADAPDGPDSDLPTPGWDEPPLGWRGHVPPEEDEHFEPAPPAPLPPAHDATYWLALAGLILGPLLVIWAAVLSHNPDPGWWVLLGVAATIVGFGLLVLRGSGERDPDDDGARV